MPADSLTSILAILSIVFGGGGLVGSLTIFVRLGRLLQRLDRLEKDRDDHRSDIGALHARVDTTNNVVAELSKVQSVLKEGLADRLRVLDKMEGSVADMISKQLVTVNRLNGLDSLAQGASTDIRAMERELIQLAQRVRHLEEFLR